MTIGKRLKKIRNDLIGISAEKMADKVGVSPRTYGGYERDEITLSQKLIMFLATEYFINIHWLFTGEGDMLSKPKNTFEIKCEPLKIDKYEFGKRLNKIRINADLISNQMAEMLGISEKELAGLTVGNGKITVELIQKICENFNITADWLLFGKE